jgi:hypothetical protein
VNGSLKCHLILELDIFSQEGKVECGIVVSFVRGVGSNNVVLQGDDNRRIA